MFVLEQSEIEFKLEHLTDCVLTGVAVAWDLDALFTVASSLHSFNYEDKFNVFLKINDHFQLPGHRLWNYCGIYVEYLWSKLVFKGSPWIYIVSVEHLSLYCCKCIIQMLSCCKWIIQFIVDIFAQQTKFLLQNAKIQ